MIIEGGPSSSGQKNTPGFIELHELRWMAPTLRWRKPLIPRESPNRRFSVFNFSLNDGRGAEVVCREDAALPKRPIGRRRSKPILGSSAIKPDNEWALSDE
jgi:hypothetical protein